MFNVFQLCTEFNIQPENYTKLKSLLIQVDSKYRIIVLVLIINVFRKTYFHLKNTKLLTQTLNRQKLMLML